MKIYASVWQNLVPSALPAKCLTVKPRDYNPMKSLQSFDFDGFTPIKRGMISRGDFDFDRAAYFFSPLCAARIVARENHYGPFFSIVLTGATIEFVDHYMDANDACQKTATKLLRHLTVEPNLEFRWSMWSEYFDNGERSRVREGNADELRALLSSKNQNAK